MNKNISSRFKIEYNDMYQNYKDSIYLNNNNNIVLMKTKMGKNISSSKLEFLKQKYLIKEKLKKEKIMISNTNKPNNSNNNPKEKENETFDFDFDCDLPIINLSDDLNNQDDYLLNLTIDNKNIKENNLEDENFSIGIDIDNYNYLENHKESIIINLNETTVYLQDKIIY